jgi:hypothetical protein
VCAIGFGVVVVTEAFPSTLHHWLSVHERNGWLFLGAGAVGFLAAFVLPTVRTGGRSTVVEERRVVEPIAPSRARTAEPASEPVEVAAPEREREHTRH